jgi:hypothetical protein
MPVPLELSDGGAIMYRYVPGSLDSIHQVARHLAPQVLGPADHVHVACVPREVGDCLPSRIAGSDHHGLFTATLASLHFSGRVVDTGPLELLQTGHRRLPILNSAGDHYAAGPKPGLILQSHDPLAAVDAQRLDG